MIRRFSVTALLAMIAAGFFAPSGASAHEGACPDGMTPTPATGPQAHHDRNNDGLVCTKPKKDGRVSGGPDNDEEEPPVDGALTVVIAGVEWWIVDNVY